jgi:hypothetical protein
MDKASPSEGGDWGFESPRGRFFVVIFDCVKVSKIAPLPVLDLQALALHAWSRTVGLFVGSLKANEEAAQRSRHTPTSKKECTRRPYLHLPRPRRRLPQNKSASTSAPLTASHPARTHLAVGGTDRTTGQARTTCPARTTYPPGSSPPVESAARPPRASSAVTGPAPPAAAA